MCNACLKACLACKFIYQLIVFMALLQHMALVGLLSAHGSIMNVLCCQLLWHFCLGVYSQFSTGFFQAQLCTVGCCATLWLVSYVAKGTRFPFHWIESAFEWEQVFGPVDHYVKLLEVNLFSVVRKLHCYGFILVSIQGGFCLVFLKSSLNVASGGKWVMLSGEREKVIDLLFWGNFREWHDVQWPCFMSPRNSLKPTASLR